MKKCPKCNKTWPDEYDGCPGCGVDLIDINKSPMDNHTSNTSAGSALSDSHERSTVNVGKDNAIAGGVHSTDNSTDSHDITETKSNSENTTITKNNSENTSITNNTTIYESKKSESEILEENLRAYRFECRRQYKNGLISKDGQNILLERQREYKLPDESVKTIEDEIREISRTPIKQIPQTVIYEINNTKTIIEQNFPNAIQNQLVKFKSWVKEYDNDTLKFWYYHLSSVLEPARFTEMYEASVKDEYWEVFWSFIAYMLQNKVERAYDAHALLGRLQPFYPEMHEQNDVVLMISGHLIQNDSIEDIKRAYNTHAIYCTKELIPLLNSIDCLLQMDWTRESPTIPSTQSFYVNTLFKSFVETQKKRGEEIRIETGRISREEMEKQKELRDQKAALLDKFQELKNVEKACKVLDIPYYTTFQDWLNEDPSFRTKYNEIVCRIDEGSKECAEQEERLRRQKDDFKLLYKQNNCDTLKTCSDLGIGRDTVEDWKKSDSAFTDALAIIDREHKKQLQELFIQFYEANDCDVRKSCAETGISEEEYNDWRNSNESFVEVLTSIEQERIKELKDTFIKYYGDNNCNLQKACIELKITPETINEWIETDLSFAGEIKYSEDNNKRERNKKKWERFKKTYLPILFSAVLLIVIFSLVRPIIAYRVKLKKLQEIENIQEKKRQEEIITHYNKLLLDFDSACDSVNDEKSIDDFKSSLLRIEQVMAEIKEKEVANTTIIKPKSDSLLREVTSLYQVLHDTLRNNASATMDINEFNIYREKIEFLKSLQKKL